MFFKDEYSRLEYIDTFNYLEHLPLKSIDTIIADPPYFLSNGGTSNSGGKKVCVDKGSWDKNEDPVSFYERFIVDSYRVLKDGGTIWIFGTMHNIYIVGYLLRKHHFRILNNITWQKENPVPNLCKRMFNHSTETILWAKKGNNHIFNYDILYKEKGVQMKDVWTTPTIGKYEKRFGYHPTQKPLSVLKRIIKASTIENSIILDPFVGSGTTCVAGKLLNRKVIGVDNKLSYLRIAQRRIYDFQNEREGPII